jgi:hypothetical protein
MTAWAALSVVDEVATVADYLGVDARGADLPALFAAAADEARRLGARRLAFWIPRGRPGRAPIEASRGERLDAGSPSSRACSTRRPWPLRRARAPRSVAVRPDLNPGRGRCIPGR